MNNRDEGMTDRLLFEYLEGKLSPKRAKALEERLAADPALRGELELWQASYVESDFYDTQALEKGLLKEPVKMPVSAAAGWRLGLVLLVAALLLAHLAIEKEPAAVGERIAAVAAGTAGNSMARESAAVNNQPNSLAVPQVGEQPKVLRGKTLPERVLTGQHFSQNKPGNAFLTVKIRPLTPILITENALAPVALPTGRVKVQVKTRNVALPKTLSRKQQRAIARMKERSRQQREASRFLKGNIPYVVPLNSNDF